MIYVDALLLENRHDIYRNMISEIYGINEQIRYD